MIYINEIKPNEFKDNSLIAAAYHVLKDLQFDEPVRFPDLIDAKGRLVKATSVFGAIHYVASAKGWTVNTGFAPNSTDFQVVKSRKGFHKEAKSA